MNEKPFFSIIVPTYNRAPLLERTIGSILSQVFPNFELLLIDDGSTDDTRAVVESLGQQDARIHYHYQVNAERGAARNTGIRSARGLYLIFFDSDDEMKPEYLRILYDGILRNPDYLFYAAKYNFADGIKIEQSSVSSLASGAYNLSLVLKGNPFSCNFCVRADNTGLIKFREDRMLASTEDWIFLVENLRDKEILLIDAIGLHMHQHEERSMHQHQLLIRRRIAATEFLTAGNQFSVHETKLLWAYTWYFCSIHAYLDKRRYQSLQFINKAIRRIGPNAVFIKAAFKYSAGRQLINMLKGKKIAAL